MRIIDIRDEVDDGKFKSRDIERISTIAVHRVGRLLDSRGRVVGFIGNTAEEICQRFVHDPEVAKYTGAEIAYTFIIEATGLIKQCLSIDDIGQHARRWNTEAIGVACVGDFRHEHPHKPQHEALIDLLTELCHAWALDPRAAVKGHTELPGSTSTPGKDCPGSMISPDSLGMDGIRRDVIQKMRMSAKDRLQASGLVWTDNDKRA